MEWLAALRGQVIGLDTAPLIYFIEEDPAYLQLVRPFFEALDQGEFQVVTSTVTLLEVLVHPLRHGNTELAGQYREILLNSTGVFCIALFDDIAEEAARLRSEYNLGTSYFFTNDHRLPSLPGLEMLVLQDLVRENL